MQMNRVNIVARIAHADAVALPLVQVKGWLCRHLLHGIGYPVDRPLVESVERGVLLFEEHVERFVRLRRGCAEITEVRIVPLERPWRNPLWFAFGSGIFDDDPHAV